MREVTLNDLRRHPGPTLRAVDDGEVLMSRAGGRAMARRRGPFSQEVADYALGQRDPMAIHRRGFHRPIGTLDRNAGD